MGDWGNGSTNESLGAASACNNGLWKLTVRLFYGTDREALCRGLCIAYQ